VAVGVSGVVFAGAAGLVVGAAAPVSAAILATAPQQAICGHGRAHSSCANRSRHTNRNRNRQHSRQRVIVVNRIQNTAKADSDQLQRHWQGQNLQDLGDTASSSASSSTTSSAAAGGGSGAGGGGGGGGGGGPQAIQSGVVGVGGPGAGTS
jgi:hypothetical protein